MTDPTASPNRHETLLSKFQSMETSKKYTLVFLVSVGTTLLVTGASGGRLLKRAKRTEASAPVASTSKLSIDTSKSRNVVPAAEQGPPRSQSESLLGRLGKRRRALDAATPPVPIPRRTGFEAPLPTPPTPVFADPHALSPRKSLLRSWRSPTASPRSPSAYFLPNTTIVNNSTAFAEALDKADKAHELGAEAMAREASAAHTDVDDDFNPAMYAFKAFAIATAITVSAFAVSIVALMKYLEVDSLEGLALALSQSVPKKIDAHRPTVPAWARPDAEQGLSRQWSHSSTILHDKDRVEQEELSYWASFKQSLDEEAAEMRQERQKAWQRLQAERDAKRNVTGSSDRMV
ncbi:hypothetical protein OIV83_005541 [Microbotryomycetes sp. JL201]|nr:hypothetical protein OIV83_005541 [Microbotryomycetes sp. JL201]